MRCALSILLGTLGCARAETPPPLDSPVAAARCEARAIRSRDAAVLVACMHPMMRDRARRELARGEPEWASFEAHLGRLEQASESDFSLTPAPQDRRTFGDRVAELPLDRDSLTVVRAADGRWYIVDTGL